jgi:hypothetical protein
MSDQPQEAPAAIRKQIVEAFRDPARWFLDWKSSSRNFLDLWDLSADGFVADLADGLEREGLLFLKPITKPGQPQRYQCVLAYPEDEPYPALDIHVTLSPRGEPPKVKIAVHPSDTVRTLPRIQAYPPSDEDHDNET